MRALGIALVLACLVWIQACGPGLNLGGSRTTLTTILYAAGISGDYAAAVSSTGVYKSTDGGVSWTLASTFPYGASRGIASTVLNGTLYVVSGANATYGVYYTDVWSTTDGVNWTFRGNLPSARGTAAMAAFGSDLYVMGGFDSAGTAQTTVYKSSDQGQNWVACAQSLPIATKAGVAVTVGGYIWFMGGENGGYYNSARRSGADPCNNVWSASNNMPASMARSGVGVLNGKIYVVGGYNAATSNSVFEGTVSGTTVTWVNYAGVLPGGLIVPTVVTYKNQLMILGGTDYAGGGGAKSSITVSSDGQTWTTPAGAAMPLAVGDGRAMVY